MSYFSGVLQKSALRCLMPALLLLTIFSAHANTSYGPWQSAPIRGGGYLQQVVFAPSDPNRLYLSSDVGGLFGSWDGGKTWRMLHGGLPADAASYSIRGLAVHPKDANRILIGAGSPWGRSSGVWLSTNGGDSWKRTLEARFDGNGAHRAAGNVVVVSPHDPNLVLAGSLGGGIRRSLDGGETWTSSGPDDLSPTHILFDRTNARRVWLCARPWREVKQKRADGTEVGLRGGLFLSEDTGQTWTEISNTSPSEMYQAPNDAAVLFGLMREQQVVRSTDKGRTWTAFSMGLAPWGKGEARNDGTYEALAVGPDFLLAGGHGGHFYRLDSNQSTWRKIEPQQINEGEWWGRIKPNSYRHFGSAMGFIGVNPHNPKHWVFTDWYALYQSYDQGQTWNLTLDGIEMVVLNTVAQEPTNPNVFHAGMADVGYFRSPDNGKTMQWITKGISNNIKSIVAAPTQPGRLYATGPREWQWHANEVFISDDAGLSWRRSGLKGIPEMETRRSEFVAAHPAKKDEVWVTISGPVKPGQGGPWRSTDGGQNWTWQGQGLPELDAFFHSSYWVAGPELAISGDGSMIASSDDKHLLARRGPNDAAWTMIKVPDGAPNCVSADPLQPGRFYVALQGGGLWRSDDSGQSWKNIIDRDINWVTPDLKVKDRVAAVAPWGVLVSTDAGATWREMSRALPYRHSRNSVCFAGEQIVVGTGGNGVFYAPLTALQGTAVPRARNQSTLTPVVASEALPVAIAATDKNIRYVGRFDTRDENGPRAAWPASTVALKFRGTTLNVRIGDGNANRWQVEVDGKPTTILQMRNGAHLYRVASDLPDGEHTIRLVKATEALFGTSQIQGFQLNQGARILPLTAPSRRIEVVGDSISAGYGNEAANKEEKFSPQTENAYFTYGAMTARELGADYTCLAWSGKKLWPNNTLPELYDRSLPTDEGSSWDYSQSVPDVVLINLATNDFAGGIPNETGWTNAYKTFIARVRKNYPQAAIYCAIGPMMGDWGKDKPLTTLRAYLAKTVADVHAMGDTNVRIIDFGTQDAANGFGADWHPNIKTHRFMAAQWVQTLRKDMKW
jgi:photosystem II stability/assembly factor-like uncharacterized protein